MNSCKTRNKRWPKKPTQPERYRWRGLSVYMVILSDHPKFPQPAGQSRSDRSDPAIPGTFQTLSRQRLWRWRRSPCLYRAVLLFQENLWLTQAKMAELFEVQKAAISKHLKNIFESGELSEDSVVSKMETTAADGKRYQTNYYNLDAIIAVGYRVNSKKATMFRIWANRVLKVHHQRLCDG